MSSSITPENRVLLATVSSATLTTALFKRGLKNTFTQDVHPLNPKAASMVGEAYTLRYIPSREDLDCIDVPVFPGDIVVGDGEGVVVIPAYEDFVSERITRSHGLAMADASRTARCSVPRRLARG